MNVTEALNPTLADQRRPLRGWARLCFVLGRLGLAIKVWRERRALGRLTPEQLADAGINAGDAGREARRPPWDLPDNR